MKHFATMVAAVEMTNKTLVRRQALIDYFETAADSDKLWMIKLFTGKRPRRPVTTKLMRQWCLELIDIPEWLFTESYNAVGDLGETISLVLPEPTQTIDKSLTQWMTELIAIGDESEEEKRSYVLTAWSGLNQQDRFIFNKLIGGSFRIGVSKKGLVNALAKYSGQEPDMLMHALIGDWTLEEITFNQLVSGEHINHDASKPYPFCLAHSLDKSAEELGNAAAWQAEYKWDGIRGQLIKRDGEVFIWSRGEELITAQFPELVDALADCQYEFVIDGEILPVQNDEILNFSELQRRLNRKTISKSLLKSVPIHFFAYDCLEINGKDIRQQPLKDRNQSLSRVLQHIESANIHRSNTIPYANWDELAMLRARAREAHSEGIMLKSLNSIYHAGRKKGDWWKWKVDPLTIDAVMIYAQRGSGRRSGHYTDYTFAVRTGKLTENGEAELVPVAKAYSGLSNDEIVEVSRWVKKNGLEKFGPVRTVKPELVFEIAFEGIAESKRHKSGVALRFPRISRWRRDKPVDEIDTVATVKALLDIY